MQETPQTRQEPSVSGLELATFTRQLGAMLAANVSVLRALPIASHYTGNDHLIRIAAEVGAALTDGRELHQALGRHPELFDAFYVEMARQGEADGTLGESLLAVADYLDHHDLRSAGTGQEATPPAVDPVRAAGGTLGALGTMALGTGLLWSLSAAGALPLAWVGPLAAVWSGVCLLGAASRLLRVAPASSQQPPVAELPPKSPERRRAEADGLVRNALLEEQEAEESASLPVEPEIELNGKGGHDAPRRESEPPRFSF
jgi:hypothetical protein